MPNSRPFTVTSTSQGEMPLMVEELLSHCTMPEINEALARVTTSEGMRKYTMKNAFTAPTVMPAASAINSVHPMGTECQTFSTPMIMAASVTTAPTDRS